MNMEKHRKHKESIGSVSPFAKKLIFWSFVSLFCIYGDIYVGTTEKTEATDNMVTLFGIGFLGLQRRNFGTFCLHQTSTIQ